MKNKFVLATSLIVLSAGSLGGTVSAATTNNNQTLACGNNTIVLPASYVNGIWGNPGDIKPLATVNVPASLLGQTVAVSTEIDNNGSTHPGTNVTIASDSTSFSLNDVEATSNEVTKGNGNLTLGNTVDMTVQLGVDGVSSISGELDVNVTCATGGQGGGVVLSATTPQVVAPAVTSVSAGNGGATASKVATLVGAAGSLIAIVAGLALRRRASSL